MGVKRLSDVTSLCLFILVISSLLIQVVKSSVIHDNNVDTPIYNGDLESTGRLFYSALGDVLMRIPFLPFTVNVPDTISSVQGFFSYFFGGSEESSDEPRDVMKLVKSALEITDFEDLEEDMFF